MQFCLIAGRIDLDQLMELTEVMEYNMLLDIMADRYSFIVVIGTAYHHCVSHSSARWRDTA